MEPLVMPHLPTPQHVNPGCPHLAELYPNCRSDYAWCTCLRNRTTQDAPTVRTGHVDHDRREHTQEGGIPRSHSQRAPLPTEESAWQVGVEDIERAVELAGNSAPGPDGIPYAAWKLSGAQAIQVLYDAMCALQSDQAAEMLETMHGTDQHMEGACF